MSALLLLVWMGAPPDLCATAPAPQGPLDSTGAAAYAQVGADELAAGRKDTALSAYRAAFDRTPTSSPVRAALAHLCFEAGLERLQRGAAASARTAFDFAFELDGEPAAALLAGVTAYQSGALDLAQARLERARQEPSLAAGADLYLGLVAHRRGEDREASLRFDHAAADPGLVAVARELRGILLDDRRLVLSLYVESAYDSNVPLAPDGTPLAGGSSGGPGDGSGGLSLAAAFRPLGGSGPYVRAGGDGRYQLTLRDYDLLSGAAGAGWQQTVGPLSLLGEYAYEAVQLGGAPYVAAHRLSARAVLTVGPWLGAARWFGRFESYPGLTYAPYSGFHQEGQLTGGRRIFEGLLASLGWILGQDGTQDPSLSFLEQGPRASVRWNLERPLRFGVEAALTWRTYVASDPALGVVRADQYLDGTAYGEWLPLPDLVVHLSASGRRALSDVPDFVYSKAVVSLSLAYTVEAL